MPDSNWNEQYEKHLQSKTEKRPSKKKDYRSGKTISRIFLWSLLKSPKRQPKIDDSKKDIKVEEIRSETSMQYWKKLKAKLRQAAKAYLGKYGREVKLNTSSIMQRFRWTKHNRQMDKMQHPALPQEKRNISELQSHQYYCYTC